MPILGMTLHHHRMLEDEMVRLKKRNATIRDVPHWEDGPDTVHIPQIMPLLIRKLHSILAPPVTEADVVLIGRCKDAFGGAKVHEKRALLQHLST